MSEMQSVESERVVGVRGSGTYIIFAQRGVDTVGRRLQRAEALGVLLELRRRLLEKRIKAKIDSHM